MRVLFFAPHPDDIEVFAPGTAMRHSDRGDEVIEIIMSYGEKGALDESLIGERLAGIRRREGKRGAEVMGIKEVRFLGYEDIGISASEDTTRWWTMSSVEVTEMDVERIKDTILEIKPDLIYAPSCIRSPYRHKDHLATGKLVLGACGQIEDPPPVRLYHALFPDLLVDVTKYFGRVLDAQEPHESQRFMLRSLRPILRLYARLLGIRKGCKYAEGFIEIRHGERRAELAGALDPMSRYVQPVLNCVMTLLEYHARTCGLLFTSLNDWIALILPGQYPPR